VNDSLQLGTYERKSDAIARVNEAGAHAATHVSGSVSIDITEARRGYVVTLSGSRADIAAFKNGWR
jgi:hypothetical protein